MGRRRRCASGCWSTGCSWARRPSRPPGSPSSARPASASPASCVDRRSLPNAVILSQISMNSTRIIGPAAGGALIGVAWIGTAGTYLITAALMVIALVIIIPLPKQAKVDRSDRPSPIAELRDGMRYVRGQPPGAAADHLVVRRDHVRLPLHRLPAAHGHRGLRRRFGRLRDHERRQRRGRRHRLAAHRPASPAPNSWRIQVLAGIVFGIGIVALGIAPSFPLALPPCSWWAAAPRPSRP